MRMVRQNVETDRDKDRETWAKTHRDGDSQIPMVRRRYGAAHRYRGRGGQTKIPKKGVRQI